MEKREMIKWAIVGLYSEMEKIEKDIRKGKSYIAAMQNGEKVNTPLTMHEVMEKIREKQAMIKELDRKRFDLQWELSENESN